MIVRELITKMGFATDGASINRVDKATDKLKDRAEAAAGAFRNIITAFAGFAAIKGVIAIGDEMQSLRVRIGQMAQTIGDAGSAFDEIAKRATASGVSVAAYSELYTKTGNAAKDYIKTQEDLLGITDTISQALTVGGASALDASRVMTQFSQALGSGVLQGDEFRSMAEAAPQYLDKLSETMQIPREQLKKMAADGKLTAKAVIEATRQMSTYFSEKFKEMPMTVGRATVVVANHWGMMIDRFNRESMFITRIANMILAGLEMVEGGINKLVDLFGGWGNMIRLVGFALGVAFGAKAIAILAAFRIATLAALWPFIRMAALISAAALVLEDFYVWIEGGDSITGKLIGPWAKWSAYVFAAWAMLKDVMSMTTAEIGAKLESVFAQWGSMIYSAIFNPIISAVKNAWGAIKNLVVNGVLPPIGGAVEPAQMAPSAMGAGRPNVQNSTNVNVTVPQGTTAEQAKFLQGAAQSSFSKASDNKFARDLSLYAP